MLSVSRPIEVVVLNCWVTRDERDVVLVEDLDDPGEVDERAGQPVDLVDDDHVDAAALDIAQQPLQRRPFHRAAGEAAVVVAIGDEHPALVLLALRRRPAPPRAGRRAS